MHRVYVHEGDTWTLATTYATRHELPRKADAYVVFETERPPSVEPVCMVTRDGRRLCDIGPEHEHVDGNVTESQEDFLRRRAGMERIANGD